MLSELDFDKSEFLKQGAVFGKNNQVWLMWGEPTEHQARPEAIAITTYQFHDRDSPGWLLYPYAVQLDWQEAKNIFRTSMVSRKWTGADRKNFETQYEIVQQAFKENSIEKLVPYVFDRSETGLNHEELENALHSVLSQNKGSIYGCWKGLKGFLGLTPETLISQSREGHFSTMALAGTCELVEYEKDPQAFVENAKEQIEHLKVVEGIVTQLEDLGPVEARPLQVETTPHLAHLKTIIDLITKRQISLESLVKRLHPTPALGGYPKEEAKVFLKQFEKIEPRGIFGAPFGISYSRNSADIVVAIRNIIWTEKEVKVGSGCGVVPQSELEKEWRELVNKRISVKKIFGFLESHS